MKRWSAATSCFRWQRRSRWWVSHSASASPGSSHDVRSALLGICLFCWIAGDVRPPTPTARGWDRTDPRNDAVSTRMAAASTGAGGMVSEVAASDRPHLGQTPALLYNE